MSSVSLHPRQPPSQTPLSVVPQLLQTPTGLAVLELQGTINLPTPDDRGEGNTPQAVSIGRLDFPDYREDALDPSSTGWMKRVHLYVGRHQRLTGEVKKLPRPLAVIARKGAGVSGQQMADAEDDGVAEDLEVVEIVRYKLVFSQRPEPVGSAT